MPPAFIVPAIIAAAGIGAGATIYTQSQQAKAEKKNQDSLLQYQNEQVRNAEAKAASAEALATQEATDKIKKRRLAQTQTILTSPLGVSDQASTGIKTLLGG